MLQERLLKGVELDVGTDVNQRIEVRCCCRGFALACDLTVYCVQAIETKVEDTLAMLEEYSSVYNDAKTLIDALDGAFKSRQAKRPQQ